MKKLIVLLTALAVLAVNPMSLAGVIGFDDGGYHSINDIAYQNDEIQVDHNTENIPGTYVELKDGGVVYSLEGTRHATITMSGGSVEDDVNVTLNATFTMSGGSVGSGVHAMHDAALDISGGSMAYVYGNGRNASITMSGGSTVYDISGMGNTTITLSGGTIAESLLLYTDSTMYLVGTGFEVNGIPLINGDILSNFSTVGNDSAGDFLTGTITGTLSDGSALNNIYEIHNIGDYYEGTGNIIIVPEPASCLLLALGAIMLIRKR